MQICKPHWQAMRAAVTHRGMDHLVARSGAEAFEKIQAEMKGANTLEDWDPLMSAHWNISSMVLQQAGLTALADPDFCPLCAVQQSYEHHAEKPGAASAQTWIDSCMDAMLKYARDNKLMPQVQ